jgi:predicted amidophosphoribosyltransferase
LTTERFENVKGAFGVRRPEQFRDQAVLVIDDVMTSGATANQIAKILKRSGARAVYIATVARGARLT